MKRLQLDRTSQIFWGILLISLILRLALVLDGGQYFLTDEVRARRAVEFVDFVGDGEFTEAGRIFFNVAHPGYIGVAVPAAFISKIFFDGEPEVGRMMAALLSLFSVANIYMVFHLARRIGGGDVEALLAAFFMAAGTTMFYFARHLLPYDVSMFFTLAALWVSLGPAPRPWHFVLSGFLFAAAYAVYLGYWMIIASAGLLIVAYRPTRDMTAIARQVLYRGIMMGVGFGAPLVVSIIAGVGAGVDLAEFGDRIQEYSGTITMGQFSEGWSLPWEYMWYTEGPLLILLLLGCAVALYLLVTRRGKSHGWYWLLTLVSLYAIFVLMSTVFEVFVMYGRIARALFPYMALTAGFGFSVLFTQRTNLFRVLQVALVGVVVVVAAINFRPFFNLNFPDEYEAAIKAQYPDSYSASTVITTWYLENFDVYPDPAINTPDYDPGDARYLLLNFDNGWPFFTNIVPLPEGEIIFRKKHPFGFKPFQYEGYDPAQREMLDTRNYDMMVIDRGE